MKIRKLLEIGILAGVLATACVDLEVVNPNAPDQSRALVTSTDIEALVGGSFASWWNCSSTSAGPQAIMMTAAYQHSGTAANFGMVEFSSWPKVPVQNRAADFYYGYFQYCWIQLHRGISSVVDGFKALDSGNVNLPADDLARARAFGYFTLGLNHAHAAIVYDQSYIYDNTMSPEDVVLSPYTEVMAAAQGYLDKAIQEATGKTFTIPATWMSQDVSAANLVRMAYSMKARYRAAVARTPAERAAVSWQSVIADVDRGITETWGIRVASGSGYTSGLLVNIPRYGAWGQLSYQMLGMADTSGQYQKWLAKDPWNRHPNLSADQTSDPFLIITADTRFPRGTTLAQQQAAANKGRLYEVFTGAGGYSVGWVRPDRGTFRWSYYRYLANDQWLAAASRNIQNEITVAEMDLLKAEGLFRTGQQGAAATLVNKTRTAAGLNATDAAGTNTSCVPKLPNGQCGNLLEMLKWEVRLETPYQGLGQASWYFHGRGWGDLPEGVFLHLPVPGRELELLGAPFYTFGGIGGEAAAPKGTYGF
jgi:hypothetical protein